jgi:glucose-1-phosphate adenylyltransferase
VTDSILFDGVDVGRHARLRRAIVDKWVKVPAGMHIGYDLEQDRRRGLHVTDNGIVIIAKGDGLEHMGDASRS